MSKNLFTSYFFIVFYQFIFPDPDEGWWWAREAARAHRQKWQWQPAKLKSQLEIHRHTWGIFSWNSHCLPVKHYGTIILKGLMEAVQKVLIARTVAATSAFANTSLSDSQRATQHVRNPSCSPGHPLLTAERWMLFQQANVIRTIQNSKLFQFM